MCAICGFIGLVWLAGLTACAWHIRLSVWWALAALGLLGLAVAAVLQTLAYSSPEGEVDPYKYPENLAMLHASWIIFALSCLGTPIGFIAAIVHMNSRKKVRQRDAKTLILPNADALAGSKSRHTTRLRLHCNERGDR
jgi:hypothetical protein